MNFKKTIISFLFVIIAAVPLLLTAERGPAARTGPGDRGIGERPNMPARNEAFDNRNLDNRADYRRDEGWNDNLYVNPGGPLILNPEPIPAWAPDATDTSPIDQYYEEQLLK